MPKNLTAKEFAWLQRIEADVDKAWDDLNGFEKRFIEDLLERFRRFGERTFISPKQWEIITRISEKII